MSSANSTVSPSKRPLYNEWALLVGSAILVLVACLLPLGFWGKFTLFVVAYLCCGAEILLTSFHNLRRGEVFDENFLMTLATLGAFAIGEYPEGVSVMLFYQIGEKLQHYAAGNARRKITALMDLRPPFARLIQPDGTEKTTNPELINVGQLIRVRPGERIALDGQIVSGESQLDTSSVTGESRPAVVAPGTKVLAGTINLEGVLDIRVEANYQHSTIAQILHLAEHAASKKSSTEKFITRFARVYTPVVVLLAVAVACIPPLCGASWHDWIYKALVFLVISCPCALVLSVPLGFFGGIGGAAKHGILVKGGTYLELLTRVGTLCFDKTGTLTQGVFEVIRVVPQATIEEKELLLLAAQAEAHSNHPIAKAIVAKAGKPSNLPPKVREITGEGIEAYYNEKLLVAGNQRLLERFGFSVPVVKESVVHVAFDGEYKGYVELGDRLKDTAQQAIQQLKKSVKNIVLISGDHPMAVANTAKEVGIDTYYGGLLPAGKMQLVEDFIAQQKAGQSTVFIGDGINDAPVIKRADVGVAMGAAGTDAAMEAADVVLMGDEPIQLVNAVDLAHHTLRIIKQNIWGALGIKIIVLGLGIAGLANMWMAVFADVGVTLLTVFNSLRALYYKKP